MDVGAYGTTCRPTRSRRCVGLSVGVRLSRSHDGPGATADDRNAIHYAVPESAGPRPREDAVPSLPPEFLDSNTPADVIVTDVGRARIMDPTLGIPLGDWPLGVAPPPEHPANPLVTIGDSLTHGMSSAAVFHTELSWPAQVAGALTLQPFDIPSYGGPLDGLPVNLEKLARLLEDKFGPDLSIWETLRAAVELRSVLDKNEDYWERGAGGRGRRWTPCP
jgi:hypothetical protein